MLTFLAAVHSSGARLPTQNANSGACTTSPRALSCYALDPVIYEADAAGQVQSMDPLALRFSLNPPSFENTSDPILAIELSLNSRFAGCNKIASQHIFEALWDERLLLPPSKRIDLYRMFRSGQFAADTAGWSSI